MTRPRSIPKRFRNLPTTTAGPGWHVPVATTRLARLLGLALLGAPQAGPGLMIPGCRAVHTIGMRFALDLHFLDGAGATISVRRAVPARRFAFERRASAVLEFPSGGRG